MEKRKIIVGTRGSALAIAQTEEVIAALKKAQPDRKYEVKIIKTKGDEILTSALYAIGDKGLFVKELENALLKGEIDLAVHSVKDVPTELPPKLTLAAITPREEPRDALILNSKVKSKKTKEMSQKISSAVDRLPLAAIVGTSSLRRKAQLMNYRPDLVFDDLRGNLDTRLRKLEEEGMDAIVVAAAGLKRLKVKVKYELIPFEICLPAVGQGSLAIETREQDEDLVQLAHSVDHMSTHHAVMAERSFLAALEGGCQIPIGAYAKLENHDLILEGMISTLDGRKVVRGRLKGKSFETHKVGLELARQLRKKGGQRILEEIREQSGKTLRLRSG